MDFSSIPDFATEKSQLEFTGFWDWLVSYNDVCTLWRAQPSYICMQFLVLAGGFITLYHALENGGRFMHLWIGIILHGLFIETVSYNFPEIDNFWHSQSPVIFLGRRLPLYIMLIYLVFIYPASIAVDNLKLPNWSEPFAVGLVTVLIDYPYDIMGVRLMHWTWHDTDPNISERHYHVPWNSFYFHAAFTTSFTFLFHFTRFIVFGKTKKWKKSESSPKEFGCTIVTALFGMPGGILIFILLYHPLHDIYKIHSEVSLFLLLAMFLNIVWCSSSKVLKEHTNSINQTTNCVVLLYMTFYYTFFVGMAAFIDPTTEVSIGWHEPIGPCDEKFSIRTALGYRLYRRKYLCIRDNDETYFGWSCLPNEKSPSAGARWYTICGTTLTNRVEYIIILTTTAMFGFSFFFKTLYYNCITYKLKCDHKLSMKYENKCKCD